MYGVSTTVETRKRQHLVWKTLVLTPMLGLPRSNTSATTAERVSIALAV
jgi:hypothetical protein